MSIEGIVDFQDLEDNPATRVPICLCLDTSGSMSTVEGGEYTKTGETVYKDGKTYNVVEGDVITRISEMKDGIELFIQTVKEDGTARYAADVSIVTFDSSAKCVMDFTGVNNVDDVPALIANGDTAMGEGVNLALDLLENRKQAYKDKGVDYYQPWLVLMTDGEPNGSEEELERAISRTAAMVNEKKLTIFPIGIGKEADMETLNRFSPKRAALKLRGLRFKEFFAWLSKSVSRTSQSTPGEAVPLDAAAIFNDTGWGEL